MLPCGTPFGALAKDAFLALDLIFGEHGAAAALQAAVAGRHLVGIAVEKVVVVGKLLAGLDVAQGENPYAIVNLVGLAVGIAGMVHKGRNAKAVNDDVGIIHGEEVGDLGIGVHALGFLC